MRLAKLEFLFLVSWFCPTWAFIDNYQPKPLCSLESKSTCALVANLRGSPILNWPRVYVSCFFSPFFAVCGKELERCSVEFYKCFPDDGLHGSITTFHVHHHGDRHSTCYPLCGRSSSFANDRHVSGLTVCDKSAGVKAQTVAVVRIVV